MAKRHPYGPVLIKVAFGTWRWDSFFHQVYYFPSRRRSPSITLYLTVHENTEAGALRAIVRELSPRRGGGS